MVLIEKLNHATFVNEMNSTRKYIEELHLNSVEYNYNEAFHNIVMRKINEIIDVLNCLEQRQPVIMNVTQPSLVCTCNQRGTVCCPIHPNVMH